MSGYRSDHPCRCRSFFVLRSVTKVTDARHGEGRQKKNGRRKSREIERGIHILVVFTKSFGAPRQGLFLLVGMSASTFVSSVQAGTRFADFPKNKISFVVVTWPSPLPVTKVFGAECQSIDFDGDGRVCFLHACFSSFREPPHGLWTHQYFLCKVPDTARYSANVAQIVSR